jgi:ADP-dependent NAD(P)H-hydrate dehydratase / NAD(P)H-hydrate epimerase
LQFAVLAHDNYVMKSSKQTQRILPATRTLPFALYRAEQVRHFDQIAIESYKIPGYELMTRAGIAAFQKICQLWPAIKHLTVVAGLGNNGGDGYVVARLAIQAGLSVTVFQLGEQTKIKGSALDALHDMQKAGVNLNEFTEKTILPKQTDVIVDAILGTGLERQVEGLWAAAVAQINANQSPVFAIDIASGIHSDSGQVLGCAIQADATMSFIGLKMGMFTGAGKAASGQISFDSLAVPAKVYANEILSAARITWNKTKQSVPERNVDSHKGAFGHVLIIGGDHGMGGAGLMAAKAALRSGAGLVTLACRAEHCSAVLSSQPEIMCHAVDSAKDLQPLLEKASVIAIGPGLGRTNWGKSLFDEIQACACPCVVDADALYFLRQQLSVRENRIITPHPGEAGMLLAKSNQEIQQNRFESSQNLLNLYGGVVVLKGAGTLVSVLDKPFYICQEGNPGMASGGMGDVLTGIIAGLLAQGLSPEEAAKTGVCLHAKAADLAAKSGQRGLLATDLLVHMRMLLE